MGKYLTGMISLFLQCFSVLFGFKYLCWMILLLHFFAGL